MPAINLKAHYDGHAILLDEAFELPPNAQLIVTVLTPGEGEEERAAWSDLSRASLARAYGDDEPEYSDSDLLP